MIEEGTSWPRSFAHHNFALQNANHAHHCTSSCYKKRPVAKKCDQTQKVQRCRFDFDRIVTLVDPETQKTRAFLRKGKALVATPVVQATNERNEYGRILPYRSRPFISQTNDVTQVCGQCNADYQFQGRFPPENALENARAGHSDIVLLFGRRKLTDKQKRLLRFFGVATRSSHIADFYATKYYAKPQQTLSSGLGAIIWGLQKLEARQVAPAEPQNEDLAQQALRIMRSATFAIQ